MDKMKEIMFEDFDLMEIGNKLEITGVLYGNSEKNDILMVLPGEEVDPMYLSIMSPTMDDWRKIVRQSDIKEVKLIGGNNKDKKIVLRKSTRQIETRIMWNTFRRDNFTCRYCGNDEAPMTVDHIVLWEEGGPTIVMNLITSCKKCNNSRGSMQYEDWLVSPQYLSRSIALDDITRLANDKVADKLPEIRKNHLRIHKRSR